MNRRKVTLCLILIGALLAALLVLLIVVPYVSPKMTVKYYPIFSVSQRVAAKDRVTLAPLFIDRIRATPSHGERIKEMTISSDVEYRRLAAVTLVDMPNIIDGDSIVKLLNDSDAYVRTWAARALARKGDKKYIQILREARDKEADFMVKVEIGDSIKMLEGKP